MNEKTRVLSSLFIVEK